MNNTQRILLLERAEERLFKEIAAGVALGRIPPVKLSFEDITVFHSLVIGLLLEGDELAKANAHEKHLNVDFYPEDELWVEILPFHPEEQGITR